MCSGDDGEEVGAAAFDQMAARVQQQRLVRASLRRFSARQHVLHVAGRLEASEVGDCSFLTDAADYRSGARSGTSASG